MKETARTRGTSLTGERASGKESRAVREAKEKRKGEKRI